MVQILTHHSVVDADRKVCIHEMHLQERARPKEGEERKKHWGQIKKINESIEVSPFVSSKHGA